MATVKQLLDQLAAGKVTVQQVASDFRRRSWPARKQASRAEAWGVADDEIDDDPNSWAVVEADSRLSAAQYAILAKAHG